MKFKLKLNRENGTIEEIEKNFTVKDIKTTSEGLPAEDKAGEYLYIVQFKGNQSMLPYYYYKMSDKSTVPCSTGVSLETPIE